MFLALGLLTAIVGALFCFRERHIKRLLAFSTISHAGMFLVGIALLTPLGLAGAAVYVAGHAMVKAALFLCTGIVLHRLGSVNETWLHGRGRRLPVTGVIFTLAAFGLADLPPFATYLGLGWITGSSGAHGMTWVTALLVFASVLAGGAVLRVAGGVFYGLGDPPSEDPQMARGVRRGDERDRRGQAANPAHHDHPARAAGRRRPGHWAATPSGCRGRGGRGALPGPGRLQRAVLYGARARARGRPLPPLSPPGSARRTWSSAWARPPGRRSSPSLGLYWRRLPLLRRGFEPGTGLVRPLERFQSGVVNDYVTWIVIGVACLGGALAFSIR